MWMDTNEFARRIYRVTQGITAVFNSPFRFFMC